VAQKKVNDHAVCERNLRKWFHSCRMWMPELGSRDDKELIFFVILLMLNILCDIIHDAIDKHVYVWWIWLIEQSDSFGNNWLQLLQQKVDVLNSIWLIF